MAITTYSNEGDQPRKPRTYRDIQELKQQNLDERQRELDTKLEVAKRNEIIRKRNAAMDSRSTAVRNRDSIAEHLAEVTKQGRKEAIRILSDQLEQAQAIVSKEEQKKALLSHPKIQDCYDYIQRFGTEYDNDLQDKLKFAADVASQLDNCPPEAVAEQFWNDVGPIKREQLQREEARKAKADQRVKDLEIKSLKAQKDGAAAQVKQRKLEGGDGGHPEE